MSEPISITIPIPPRAAHPNARAHWRSKAAAKKKQREHAYIAALEALDAKPAPRWELASIHATFYRGDTGRSSDLDNLLAWLKGTFDGLEDAGVVVSDRGLVPLAPSQICGKAACGECKVVLIVTKIEAA